MTHAAAPSSPSVSSQALLREVKHGSPQAFETLVQKYSRRLYAVSLRIVGNRQDAEDAVQVTFLKVLKSIDTFQENSSLYTWIYRIVCNESLMTIRKRGRREMVPIAPFMPQFEEGQHVEHIIDWSDSPDLKLRSKELAEFFEQCVAELPEHYRVAYVLKDIEKISEEEVSEILGINKSTMKNRVHRARLAIRERISQQLDLPLRKGQE